MIQFQHTTQLVSIHKLFLQIVLTIPLHLLPNPVISEKRAQRKLPQTDGPLAGL